MLISDLEYLDFANGERSIDGGESVQAFSGAAAVVSTRLIDAPPGTLAYSRAGAASFSMVDGDYARTNSASSVEFGILA